MSNVNLCVHSAAANAAPTTAKAVNTQVTICPYPEHPDRYVIINSETKVIKDDAQTHGFKSIESAMAFARRQRWDIKEITNDEIPVISKLSSDCTEQKSVDKMGVAKESKLKGSPTMPTIKAVVIIAPYPGHPGRYVIVDPATKEVLADCQTHGFSTYQRAINYANQRKWVVMFNYNHKNINSNNNNIYKLY